MVTAQNGKKIAFLHNYLNGAQNAFTSQYHGDIKNRPNSNSCFPIILLEINRNTLKSISRFRRQMYIDINIGNGDPLIPLR